MTRPLADVDPRRRRRPRWSRRDAARAAVRAALLAGAALLASEQLGVAAVVPGRRPSATSRSATSSAGRSASFQALKHRLADLWLEVESGPRGGPLRRGVRSPTGDPDAAGRGRRGAGVLLATVAVHAAEECVQLHGGIGMTWEHPAHLYLKRAKADQIALGTPGRAPRARWPPWSTCPHPTPRGTPDPWT